MSDDTKYNGWSNYQTWAAGLWMDNDEGSSGYWAEQAQEAFDNAEADEYSTREQVAARDLAERMEQEHEEVAEQATGITGLLSDLLSSALNLINWREIADHHMDEVDKSAEQTDEDELETA